VEQFRKQPPASDQLTLYELYAAQMRAGDETPLDEKLFRLCIEQGRFHIFIDGLDEIISQLPSLWQDSSFLHNVISESSESLFTKVIITCRSSFFSDKTLAEHSLRISKFSLIAFDQGQAEAYFEAAFPSDLTKKRAALKLLEELTPTKGEVLPFVLDVIRYILQRGSATAGDARPNFDSMLLSVNLNVDTILWRICAREAGKQDLHLEPDDQLWILATLAATAHRAPWLEEALPQYASETLGRPVPEQAFNWFLEHPFLIRSADRLIRFRFDFLQDHFANLYLGLVLRGQLTDGQFSTDIVLYLVSEYCGLNSSFNRDLAVRISQDMDTAKLKVIDLISALRRKRENLRLNVQEYASVVFRLFGILLQWLIRDGRATIPANTALALDIFGADNGTRLCGVCIVDDGGLQEAKIRLDLSGLTIEDSVFLGYSDFWSCRADATTRFERCRIQNCHGQAQSRHGMRDATFGLSCVLDGTAIKNIRGMALKMGAKRSQAEGAVRTLLADFRSAGGSKPKLKGYLQDYYKSQGPFSFNEVWDLLIQDQIVVSEDDKWFRVNPKYATHVEKFVYDALPFEVIDHVINGLLE
jgi:hypothetical protein